MPDLAAEHKLERIRHAVVEFGRLAHANVRDPSDWPAEVYAFLGRAGAILDIPHSEYQS
ncbi:MAG TPA: hypothetical protein VN870_09245 [Streptosporangiaceae bacterium]|nr:hypothetical protein [Streptosporangiaceae bacterium]